MKRKDFIILAVVSLGVLFAVLFGLHQKEVHRKELEIQKQKLETQRKALMPEWAAIWEAGVADPFYKKPEKIPLSKRVSRALEKQYPIGTPSEKIFSDCKALGYDLIKKETNTLFKATRLPPFKFTKEFPCRFNVCTGSHTYSDSGSDKYSDLWLATISVSWCEEKGKVTWMRSDLGEQID